METLKTIKLVIQDRVARLTLARPEIRNAFNAEMIQELAQTFRELAHNAAVSVVVLDGEGKSFCSGADLDYMKSMAGFSLEENLADARVLDDMFWALRALPQAVIARVHGHAMGGALGLIACCDIVAAVEGTQFSFSENRIGLVPAVISPYVLEKANANAARRYMISAEVFTVWAAADAGLVEFAGGETEVDAFVGTTVATLVANGPESVRTTKAMLRRLAALPDWIQKREFTTKTIAEKRVGAEGQEGLKSFLEKRSPAWKK